VNYSFKFQSHFMSIFPFILRETIIISETHRNLSNIVTEIYYCCTVEFSYISI